MRRPAGVTMVAVLVVLSAVFDLVVGIWMILAPFGPTLAVTDPVGNPQSVPGFVMIVGGSVSVLLAGMYLWLAREVMVGSRTAYLLVNVLATLNIAFGLLRLPYGWIVIGLSALALLGANGSGARAWFSRRP